MARSDFEHHPWPDLSITTESQPGAQTTIFKVSGEIDAAASRFFDHHLHTHLAVASRFAIVDLTEVTLLTAPGIRVLVAHTSRLARTGCQMTTVASTPYIQRVLGISSVSTRLKIYTSLPAAIAACLTSDLTPADSATGDSSPDNELSGFRIVLRPPPQQP